LRIVNSSLENTVWAPRFGRMENPHADLIAKFYRAFQNGDSSRFG